MLGKQSKRMSNSDDILDNNRRDVDQRTQRAADADAEKGLYEQL